MSILHSPSVSFWLIVLSKCGIYSIICDMLEFKVAEFACRNFLLFSAVNFLFFDTVFASLIHTIRSPQAPEQCLSTFGI